MWHKLPEWQRAVDAFIKAQLRGDVTIGIGPACYVIQKDGKSVMESSSASGAILKWYQEGECQK